MRRRRLSFPRPIDVDGNAVYVEECGTVIGTNRFMSREARRVRNWLNRYLAVVDAGARRYRHARKRTRP